MSNIKKRITVLFGIFVLMTINGCFRTEHYLITDIEFNAAKEVERSEEKGHRKYIAYETTSTIKDKLIFTIDYITEFQNETACIIPNLGNVCYATSLPSVNDNELLKETFSLSFDKSFQYYENTIAEHTNVFDVESIAKEINDFRKTYRPNISLVFSDKFFENAVFDTTEEYIVTFSCRTSDNLTFSKSIAISFKK
ncbi:hypothetical protein FACS189434_09460 [Bacteroidia bacterium]|nr:hypothetical protein FACS189434_09460 [Bacteroidia bacterium]